jgi:hypothetical protein
MQLTASFDQRSPNRLLVTLLGATSFMISASARARGESTPFSSPILKPTCAKSVRMA